MELHGGHGEVRMAAKREDLASCRCRCLLLFAVAGLAC